jgi:hypothetical protein
MLRQQLRAAQLDLPAALELALTDELIAAVKLLFVLESLPGARKTDTRRTLSALGVDPATPVGVLDGHQRHLMCETFGSGPGPNAPADRIEPSTTQASTSEEQR